MINKSRFRYFSALAPSLVIEANNQWAHILAPLRDAYLQAKFVCITRDRAGWVQSWRNRGDRHSEKDRAGSSRLTAAILGEMPHHEWNALSTEERLNWEWEHTDRLLREFADSEPRAEIFSFEELFQEQAREKGFTRLLEFVTNSPGRKYHYRFDPAILENQVNQSHHKH